MGMFDFLPKTEDNRGNLFKMILARLAHTDNLGKLPLNNQTTGWFR